MNFNRRSLQIRINHYSRGEVGYVVNVALYNYRQPIQSGRMIRTRIQEEDDEVVQVEDEVAPVGTFRENRLYGGGGILVVSANLTQSPFSIYRA